MKRIQKLDKEGMRQNNIRLIFETIYRNSGITKTQLAAKTGMSAMAVGRIADFLLEQGIIAEEDAREANGLGRPAKQLCLRRDSILNIGVSLDVDGACIGLVNPYGRIVARDALRFAQKPAGAEETLRQVAGFIGAFVQKNRLASLPCIGLTLPGIIDNETGRLRFASQFHWKDVPVAALLEGCEGMPKVVLDNDVKARAQAESRFGAGAGYPCSVLLNIGSGIGAGVIVDNEVYRGKDNMAGEIGHIAINTGSRMCECGRIGCLQAIITDAALLKEAGSVCPGIGMDELVAAFEKGEVWAKNLLGQFMAAMMTTIDLLANTYAPDAIILCGSLMDRNPFLRKAVQAGVESDDCLFLNRNFDICFSRFGEDGNIIGAATIAFNHNVEQLVAASAAAEPVA